jgi:hypothetical protein
VPNDSKHQPYSEKTRITCPRCEGEQIEPLAANNPGSLQEWFRCLTCDHMWSQRRDRREQGEQGSPPEAGN